MKYDNLCSVMLLAVRCDRQCKSELIEQEYVLYQNQGHFTCIPDVRQEGDQYEIISGEAIYYAARRIHLENLIVRIVNRKR